MKLADLNPKLTDTNFLIFDCPCGQCGGRIRVALEPSKLANGHSGQFPNLTLHPSINSGPGYWHGWIKNGEVTQA